jgi:hypothetical protein
VREWRMAQKFNILSSLCKKLFAYRSRYSRNKDTPTGLQQELLHFCASFIPRNIVNSNFFVGFEQWY